MVHPPSDAKGELRQLGKGMQALSHDASAKNGSEDGVSLISGRSMAVWPSEIQCHLLSCEVEEELHLKGCCVMQTH